VTTARYSTSIPSVLVGTTVANSGTIPFGDFETGRVYVPVGSTLATLTWHASLESDGAYLPARNESNTAVTTTVVAGQSYPIPSALVGSRFLKITGDVAGQVGVTMKD
jgi:hypothetical protein